MTDLDPGMSRRNFLRFATLAAASVALEGCLAESNTSDPSNAPTTPIEVISETPEPMNTPDSQPPSPSSHSRASSGNPKPSPKVTSESLTDNSSWELDFSRFPDGPLDRNIWNITTGNLRPSYNGEAQTYTDKTENVRLQNGQLIIEAQKELANQREYTSGFIDTQGVFEFKHGKLEATLKAPRGIGTWPAFWLLPSRPGAEWPLDGELDVFEAVGTREGQYFPGVHTYESENSGDNTLYGVDVNIAQFHTYGIELAPGKVTFTLDGRTVRTARRPHGADKRVWPFDQTYYPIFNLAMGGTFGGEAKGEYPPYGIAGDGPWQMAIKSIRYTPAEA